MSRTDKRLNPQQVRENEVLMARLRKDLKTFNTAEDRRKRKSQQREKMEVTTHPKERRNMSRATFNSLKKRRAEYENSGLEGHQSRSR